MSGIWHLRISSISILGGRWGKDAQSIVELKMESCVMTVLFLAMSYLSISTVLLRLLRLSRLSLVLIWDTFIIDFKYNKRRIANSE